MSTPKRTKFNYGPPTDEEVTPEITLPHGTSSRPLVIDLTGPEEPILVDLTGPESPELVDLTDPPAGATEFKTTHVDLVDPNCISYVETNDEMMYQVVIEKKFF